MNIGEFKSFITIEKNKYDEFKIIFEDTDGNQTTVTDASSEKVTTSSFCGSLATEELFVFLAKGSLGSLISADTLASILDKTADDYEMMFVDNSPGIPTHSNSIAIENARLEDTTVSSVDTGTTVSGLLWLFEDPPTPCSSSSSSSSSI